MKLNSCIVVDQKVRRGENRWTVTGTCLYPLETSLPVILKGKGCIGVAMISKLEITAESTTIYFDMKGVSEADSRAYYNLYRNQMSSSAYVEDPYDTDDQLIPGIGGFGNRRRR